MSKCFVALVTGVVLLASASAADKIRISMTGFAGQFMTFPLAQKPGFLKEEGFVKVNCYIRANRDGTVQFLTEWLKLARESAAAPDEGVRSIVDVTKKTKKLSRDVP